MVPLEHCASILRFFFVMNKAPTEKQVRKARSDLSELRQKFAGLESSVFGDLKKLASLLQNSDFDGYELNLHNPSEADLKAWYAFLDGENAKVVAAAEEATRLYARLNHLDRKEQRFEDGSGTLTLVSSTDLVSTGISPTPVT